MTCDICGSERTTTIHDIWYVDGSDLQPGAGPVILRKRGISVCLDCKSKDVDRFRRLAKKTPFKVGIIVAIVSCIVTIALLGSDKNHPGVLSVLAGGLQVGAAPGVLVGAMVYFWLIVRTSPRNILQGLVVSNAARLGLAGCIGFWLKQPLSFEYRGSVYTFTR